MDENENKNNYSWTTCYKIVLKKIKDDPFQFSFYYDKKVKHENVKTTNIKINWKVTLLSFFVY